jgi:hypothetical protein
LRRQPDRLTGGEVSVERSASRRRSSITEYSCRGINTSRQMAKSVTHVSGTSVTYLSGHSKEDIFQKGSDAARAAQYQVPPT